MPIRYLAELIRALNKDGASSKKGDGRHFGYKLHSQVDIDHCPIREMETTPASHMIAGLIYRRRVSSCSEIKGTSVF